MRRQAGICVGSEPTIAPVREVSTGPLFKPVQPYCTPGLQRAMFPQIKFPGEVPAAAGLGWTQVRVPWPAWGVARVA